MKKKILPIIILSVLFAGVVSAQETDLPDPGWTPDSPFYFLERIGEAVGTFFTFGDLKKAERQALLAAERLAEAQAVAEKDKPELIEKTLARYENQLEKSMASAEKAMAGDKNTEKAIEVVSNAGKTTAVHMGILAEVYEKVPEENRAIIEKAMQASIKGHEKAVEVLRAQNALGNIPEEVSLPVGVPQETRERIQRSAQEELMVEKVLQLSESSRELCIKAGAPQEMCEKIPVDGFESFEALKAFFIEAGAPSDQWPVAESKCKELGATTADQCFRILLISASTAYVSSEPRSVVQPTLPEGQTQETEERRRIEEEIIIRAPSESVQNPSNYVPGVSKVSIYFLPTCSYCIKAKAWMDQHNIEYEAIDISESSVELTTRTGGSGVPTLVMDGEVLIGFNEESYSEFFGMQ